MYSSGLRVPSSFAEMLARQDYKSLISDHTGAC